MSPLSNVTVNRPEFDVATEIINVTKAVITIVIRKDHLRKIGIFIFLLIQNFKSEKRTMEGDKAIGIINKYSPSLRLFPQGNVSIFKVGR